MLKAFLKVAQYNLYYNKLFKYFFCFCCLVKLLLIRFVNQKLKENCWPMLGGLVPFLSGATHSEKVC